MLTLALIIIVFACIMSVCVRVILTHPVSTVYYGVKDIYKYFRFHRWNECSTGTISCYVGLFGKGKTLSAVHKVVKLYKRYNNKRIYDLTGRNGLRRKYILSRMYP